MKKLKLRIESIGIMGGKSKLEQKGSATLLAGKDETLLISINIDTYEGYGKTYKERENPEITIHALQGLILGEIFHGTIEELKEKLQKE